VIIAGTALHKKPVQAKVRDAFGQTHYVLVEPENPEEKLESGEAVVLSGKTGAVFQALREESSLN